MYKEYTKYIVSLGNLTSIQYRCLIYLVASEATQSDLARELRTDRSNINRAVKKLKDLNLIEEVRRTTKDVINVKIYYKAIAPDVVVSRSRMSNIELLEEALSKFNNCRFGIIDNQIDNLDKVQIYKIISNLTGSSTDVGVLIEKKPYVAEISWVDDIGYDEVDIIIISKSEYENRYGRKFEDDKHGW